MVAEMVLAELAGGIAERLEQLSQCRITRLQTYGRARNADLRKPGPQRALAGDEGRSARRAALLGIVIREHRAFFGYAVDVRRLVAHQSERIGTDVRLTNIIAKDDENVWPLTGWSCWLGLCGPLLSLGHLHRSKQQVWYHRARYCVGSIQSSVIDFSNSCFPPCAEDQSNKASNPV